MDQTGSGSTGGRWVAPGAPVDLPGSAPERPAVAAGPPTAESVAAGPPRVVPLRPLRVLDILDGAFAVLKARPALVLGCSAVLVVPIQILSAWWSRDDLAALDSAFTGSPSFAGSSSTEGADIVLLYLSLIPVALLGGVMAWLVAAWTAGSDPGPGQVLRGVGGRLPALLGAWVVVHVAETVAAFTCIGLLFVVPLFLCCAPVVVVERRGPLAAVRRSSTLGSRRYWSCFWVVVASAVVSTAVSTAVSTLPSILAVVVGSEVGWVVLAVGNSLTGVLVTPVVAGAAALAYLDARIRVEGLDLELRAARVFGEPA